MDREALLGAAVANNASWCDAVCRSHSYPGKSSARVWISARHDLEFYPNAITLVPDATAADTYADQDPLVSYAHGPDLATARQAGWQSPGRLRVWERPPAS